MVRIVIAGAAGGFVSIFTSWAITGSLFHRFQRLTPETWRPEDPKQYALSSVIQLDSLVGLLIVGCACARAAS